MLFRSAFTLGETLTLSVHPDQAYVFDANGDLLTAAKGA